MGKYFSSFVGTLGIRFDIYICIFVSVRGQWVVIKKAIHPKENMVAPPTYTRPKPAVLTVMKTLRFAQGFHGKRTEIILKSSVPLFQFVSDSNV